MMKSRHVHAVGLRRVAAAVMAVSTAAALTACASGESSEAPSASGQTVTITDAQGRDVEFSQAPEIVVATDWSVVRTLNDLGIEVDGVPAAAGSLPDDLSKYADDSVAKVGGVKDLDFEAISALNPDAVFVASRSGNAETVSEIEKITPHVADMSVRYEDAEDQLPQFEERTKQLGQIFGVEDEAAERVESIKADIADVREQAQASGLKALFVQVSGGTVSAYGPGSRFGIVYDDFGFADTGAPVDDEGSHGKEITAEFLNTYNPDVIFVLDRSAAIGEDAQPALEVLNNGLVNETNAAKNDKIVSVDPFSWYLATYGISSYEQIVSDVRQAL